MVQDERSDPFAGATVMLIPEREGGLQSQLFKRVTADENGRFRIGGITPGNYTALALDAAGFGVERDPMLVQIHRNRLVSVNVGEGEQQTIDLQIARSEER